MSLARGLLLQPGDTAQASKLGTSLTFRWSDSVLGSTTARQDAVFEVASMLVNTAFWFSKVGQLLGHHDISVTRVSAVQHAAMLAAKPDISMEEAKEVHTSLRKAAGLVKFVQDSLLPQLQEKGTDGGDLDGRVCTAYINQVGGRRQEQGMTSPHNIWCGCICIL